MVRRFARPYARAMMDVAGTPEKANVVREELARFEKARSGSAEMQELFANPGIDIDSKLAITKTIAGKLGVTELSLRLLELLIRNHRMNQLGAILDALTSYVNEALGVSVANVRSAHELSEAEVAELRKTLETKVGGKVDLTVATDPTLLGGFVARIGSEIYDASVVGKINKFRNSLT